MISVALTAAAVTMPDAIPKARKDICMQYVSTSPFPFSQKVNGWTNQCQNRIDRRRQPSIIKHACEARQHRQARRGNPNNESNEHRSERLSKRVDPLINIPRPA